MPVLGLTVVWLGAVALTAPAGPERVSVLVVPPFSPSAFAGRGAVGLFVPGAGEHVTREGALASLVRGKVKSSVAGGVPSGEPLIRLGARPAPLTIYVALPPSGRNPNDRRYPIAIVGGGYRGLLTSSSTRVPGLVSLADVARAALALQQGASPRIRARADPDAAASLRELDRRLDRSNGTRAAGLALLATAVPGLCLLALVLRSRFVARAATLAAPTALLLGLFLTALDVARPWLVVLLLVLLSIAAALVGALAPPPVFPWLLVGVIVCYLVVLAAWPDTASLAPIGPHPERGGRFYGTTNLTATILLTLGLIAASLLDRKWLIPIALVTLVTVGWTRAGADGGGLLVTAVGFAVLALLLARGRLTAQTVVLVGAGAVALGLALVGLDAATGGSSHVTDALGRGPGPLLDDVGDRLHLSALRLEHPWYSPAITGAAVAAVVLLSAIGPRPPAGVALLAALAVSLLVNDTPADVAAAGAICFGVIWTLARVGEAAAPFGGQPRRSGE